MQDLFLELEQLAIDWRAMSYKYNGGYCKEYEKDNHRVWVYYARDEEHTSVSFENGGVDNIEIAFFTPCTFSLGKKYTDETVLKETIAKYRAYLIEKTKELETSEANEAEENKKREIAELEGKLAFLKGGMTEEQLIEEAKEKGVISSDSTIL